MSDGDDSHGGGDPYGGGGDPAPSTPASSTPTSSVPSKSSFGVAHQDSPQMSSSVMADKDDGGGIRDLGGSPGGSESSVSKPIGPVSGNGDAFLEVGVGGKGGLNVSIDGNECVGLNVNADLSGKGKIGTDGGDKSDGALIGVGRLADLGGLVGDHGSLIDLDFGKGDGHTAALLDVVASTDADAQASVLGSDILAGGGLDILGSAGLLDGVFDDCSLLS